MMHWIYGPLALFDTETDSAEPEDARIISAAHLLVNATVLRQYVDHTERDKVLAQEWLLQPERDIPAGATEVHGITTEAAQAKGVPRAEAVADIAHNVARFLDKGIPLVGHNIVYDLTVLDRECRRLGLPELAGQYGGRPLWPVLDTMVIDKAQDRTRYADPELGTRRLRRLCEVYSIEPPPEGLHSASSDALTAGRVLWAEVRRYPPVRNRSVSELHAVQVEWYREQAADLEDWYRHRAPAEKRDPDKVCPRVWPLFPHRTPTPSTPSAVGGG